MDSLISTFLLVTLSELGDKTQLLALTLAAKYRRPWPVLMGILVAAAVCAGVASGLGRFASEWIHPRWMAGIVGISFLGFGVWTLFSHDQEEEEAAKSNGRAGWGPFVSTAMLFTVAEMGDKTQLATLGLAAKFQEILPVAVGATLALTAVGGLAVFFGDGLSRRIPAIWIRRVAAALFILFGLVSLSQILVA